MPLRPDITIRWKASAMQELVYGSTGAEDVLLRSTVAGRVVKLAERIERLREALARLDDPHVAAILEDDRGRHEDADADESELQEVIDALWVIDPAVLTAMLAVAFPPASGVSFFTQRAEDFRSRPEDEPTP